MWFDVPVVRSGAGSSTVCGSARRPQSHAVRGAGECRTLRRQMMVYEMSATSKRNVSRSRNV